MIRGDVNVAVGGISINSRTIKPGEAFLAIKGDNFDGHDFIASALKKKAGCIIAERINNKRLSKQAAFIKVPDSLNALGDIARFNRKRFNVPVIAVTGSSGKTTLKEMIFQVLSGKFRTLKNIGTENNHIGLPMALLNLGRSHDLAVLEIGTNHFGEVDYLSGICLPNLGVITNIGPAHLEHFGDLAGVLREKYTLINRLENPGIAILNADDALLREKARFKNGVRPALGVGIDNRADFTASDVNMLSGKLKFLVNKKYKFTLNTWGYYNIYNALAAIAVARVFGMKYEEISRRLRDFSFPRGRLKARKIGRTLFIDDTYNSNPLSLKQALETLGNLRIKGRKILVMGDMLELGPHRELFHRRAGLHAACVCDALIAVGSLSGLAAQAARDKGLDPGSIFTCKDSRQARKVLFAELSPSGDDVVLVKGSRRMHMEEVFSD